MNSQDSNRKSKAKKPNNRTGGNGWKESAPQTSEPSCAGPAKPRGAGRQRLGCRDAAAAAGHPGQQHVQARHPALSLSEELGCLTVHTFIFGRHRAASPPCLQGGCVEGWVRHCV